MSKRLFVGSTFFILLTFVTPAYAAMIVTIGIEFTKNKQTQHKKHMITIDGDKVRFDFLGTTKKKTDQTPYLLTVDGGKNYILGNTRKGKFYCAKVKPVDFFKRLGSSLSNFEALVNPKTLEMKTTKTKEEPGPKILGYPTTHVQLVTTAKGQASFLFKKYEYTIKHTDDVWYTTAVEYQSFKKRWLEAMVQTGYPKMDEMFRERAKHISGPILKLESEMLTTNVKKGRTTVELEKAQITSVKEVKSSEIPQQTFVVPKCKNITQKQLISTAMDMFDESKTGW